MIPEHGNTVALSKVVVVQDGKPARAMRQRSPILQSDSIRWIVPTPRLPCLSTVVGTQMIPLWLDFYPGRLSLPLLVFRGHTSPYTFHHRFLYHKLIFALTLTILLTRTSILYSNAKQNPKRAFQFTLETTETSLTITSHFHTSKAVMLHAVPPRLIRLGVASRLE
jgi:hypothetical protein